VQISGASSAATKLIWLALRNVMAGASRSAREWIKAMNQFVLMYPERFTPQAA
jgi:transposase-like protein